MNLPNYFLADMPAGATLTAQLLSEACDTLKRNREAFLATRNTPGITSLLLEVAADWLNPEFPLRQLALRHGPGATGFSEQTLAAGLEGFFRQVTAESIDALIEQDFGHEARLDRLASSAPEQSTKKQSIAFGPELLLHITAGTLPASTLQSMVLGLLLRSAQFVKCATGASLIPRLFAHSIYRADPKLGACIEVAEWPGGTAHLEKTVFEAADCICASGSDETMAAIRASAPASARLIQYGNRVSFGYVSAELLGGTRLRETLQSAAADVVAWDQLGCLSPHVIFVEGGALTPPEKFAEMLGDELQRLEMEQPRGQLTTYQSAAIASRRGFYEVRAAHSACTQMWHSRGSTAWTVIFENNPLFQLSCTHRFIYVKRVSDLDEALRGCDAIRMKISTVGLAATSGEWPEMVEQLVRWGVRRVCPLGKMQQPPLAWRHDGRPALADMVIWCEVEAK